MSKNPQNFLKRFMKQVIFGLLKMSSLHFTLQFLVMAVLVSVMIVLSIDFIWDGRFNAELEFAGVVTPFLDGLFLVVFVNAMLDEIREELAWRKQAVAESQKQQELTTQIIETMPLRIFWKDKDLRFLGCNTQFAQDAGYASADELLGKTDFEMGWKHQAELYRADDKAVMESGNPKLYIEEPQTTPSGNTIWISTSKVPLRDESQQVIGILGIYQDITERKQSEERYRALIENMNDGVAVYQAVDDGKDFVFLEYNQASEKIGKLSRDQVIGHRLTEVFSGVVAMGLLEVMQKVYRSGNPERFFNRHYQDKRVAHWADNYIYRLPTGEIVAVYADISQRKQSESAISEQLEELRRWHDTTLGREGRILELKHEINQLLAQTGQPPRYPSAES